MSKYLGFQPTQRPDYFFISYNSEDSERVGELARQLSHANMQLWYDYGLEYGEKWESQISGKIKNSQSVILFFTKGILGKENSYVRKEYEMATKYFGKKVYVIMMDKIEPDEVPYDKVPWWIDIQENQCVDITGIDNDESVDKILEAVGISSHAEKMNMLIAEYRKLYDSGETEEAERFLSEYLHGQNLAGKAQLIANIVCGGMPGSIIGSPAIEIKNTKDENILNKMGINGRIWNECFRITIGDTQFTIINEMLGGNPSGPDPHVIRIWRNDEKLQGIYGFRDACDMKVYYDACDDIIFISLSSTSVISSRAQFTVSVITVENPLNEAVCNVFRNMRNNTR